MRSGRRGRRRSEEPEARHAAGETLERFEKWPVLRALFLWLAFALALAGIFYLTR